MHRTIALRIAIITVAVWCSLGMLPVRAADAPVPGDQMRQPFAGQRARTRLVPAIVKTDDPGALTVQLDAGPLPAAAMVKCEAIAPGGQSLGALTAQAGQRVSFKCADWPDGPYEIRCATAAPDGQRIVAHLPWYKGDMLAAANKLLAYHGPFAQPFAFPAGYTPQIRATCRMLADLVLDRLGPGKGRPATLPDNAFRSIHSALMEFEELNRAATGQAAQLRPGGFFRFACQDDIDDSWQFCRVYLPPDYDSAKKWPMVVILHGYNPPNPPYIRWWDVDRRHSELADTHHVIVIEPHGRGNTRYLGIGQQDVLRCIDLAKTHLSVDPDRVLLMGYSMGGWGTWHIGTRKPELFAAIAPIFGGWDYRASTTPDDFAQLTANDHRALEARSSYAQAEALLTTPVFLNHGDADVLVNVDYTRYAVRLLQRWGYDVRYWEHPGLGHGGLGCEDELMRWFLSLRRVTDPRCVRVRSAELKSAAAHWVKVEQREDPLAMIAVDAEVTGPDTIRLDTRNVFAATLTPSSRLIDAAQAVTVRWNGSEHRDLRMENGRLSVRAPAHAPGRLVKTPLREGPMSDVPATPFAIIVGTIGQSREMHFACQSRAIALASYWEKWQKVSPRVFTDKDLPDAELGKYSLILVGGPDANLVAQKLADRIPLRITAETITIDGREFAAKNAVVQMVYPHPLSDQRYVMVIAANSPAAMFYADGIPADVDFAIADGRLSSRLADLPSLRENDQPDPAALVAYGFFDHNWRLNDQYTILGDRDLRVIAPVRKLPKYTTAPVDQPRLDLSDLLESAAEGNFTKMKRDLNYRNRPLTLAGKTYANGISSQIVREAPSYVDFDISPGPWKQLRAAIGIETKPNATAEEKERTSITFIVKGDGRELYRSEPFRYDSPPRELTVDVAGVKRLRLELSGEARFNGAASCDWCDIRLDK